MKKHARIIGTGSYLPKKVLTNQEIEKLVDTTDEWIFERTGIKQRHIVSEEETTSHMASLAAKAAIKNANIDPNSIDLIILATSTPDYSFPSSACLVQNQLGITNNCPAFDVSAACAGFIYALSIAKQYIQSGNAKHALVIGADISSTLVDWTDRRTCILFADGAGAAVLEANETPGILSADVYANGTHKDLLYVKRGSDSYIQMQGNEVFKLAVTTLGKLVDETLAKNNVSKDEISWLIPHQANFRIIKATAKKLNLPLERVILTVQDQGNTSAASVPLALDAAIQDGRIKKNDLLLLEAFGAGLAWGSALIKY
jgi:3-oxoacyl-[acyl-carrier-protein] synthase III